MYLEERFEKEKAESIEGKRKEEQKTVSQEIDSTIFHLCDMIRNSKLLQHEMAENVLALVSLVEARTNNKKIIENQSTKQKFASCDVMGKQENTINISGQEIPTYQYLWNQMKNIKRQTIGTYIMLGLLFEIQIIILILKQL